MFHVVCWFGYSFKTHCLSTVVRSAPEAKEVAVKYKEEQGVKPHQSIASLFR